MQIKIDGNYLTVQVTTKGEISPFLVLEVGGIFGKFNAKCSSINSGPEKDQEPGADLDDESKHWRQYTYGGYVR